MRDPLKTRLDGEQSSGKLLTGKVRLTLRLYPIHSHVFEGTHEILELVDLSSPKGNFGKTRIILNEFYQVLPSNHSRKMHYILKMHSYSGTYDKHYAKFILPLT